MGKKNINDLVIKEHLDKSTFCIDDALKAGEVETMKGTIHIDRTFDETIYAAGGYRSFFCPLGSIRHDPIEQLFLAVKQFRSKVWSGELDNAYIHIVTAKLITQSEECKSLGPLWADEVRIASSLITILCVTSISINPDVEVPPYDIHLVGKGVKLFLRFAE